MSVVHDVGLVELEVLRTASVLIFLFVFAFAVRAINTNLARVVVSVDRMQHSLNQMIDRVPPPAWFAQTERHLQMLDVVRVSQDHERLASTISTLQELALLASTVQRRLEDDDVRIRALESSRSGGA